MRRYPCVAPTIGTLAPNPTSVPAVARKTRSGHPQRPLLVLWRAPATVPIKVPTPNPVAIVGTRQWPVRTNDPQPGRMAAMMPRNPPMTAPAVDSNIVVEGLGRCAVSAITCEYAAPGSAKAMRRKSAAERPRRHAENEILFITKSKVTRTALFTEKGIRVRAREKRVKRGRVGSNRERAILVGS